MLTCSPANNSGQRPLMRDMFNTSSLESTSRMSVIGSVWTVRRKKAADSRLAPLWLPLPPPSPPECWFMLSLRRVSWFNRWPIILSPWLSRLSLWHIYHIKLHNGRLPSYTFVLAFYIYGGLSLVPCFQFIQINNHRIQWSKNKIKIIINPQTKQTKQTYNK